MESTQNQKTASYAEAVRFETALRGTYGDLDYNPTFRSSALFYAVRTETIDTVLSFLNYWKIKNGNPDVAVLVTVRDRGGARCARRHIVVTETTYAFSLSELVPEMPIFEGSIEVEIMSLHDLKYPMPAVEVFFLSPDGVSFVHSNQRTFNGLEDMDRNSAFNVWQSGFDIFATDEISGFVGFVNGPRQQSDAKAQIQVFNVAGEPLELAVPFGDLPGYAARRIDFADLPEVRRHLGEQRGWCKFLIDNEGVFNRLVCGNIARDGRRLSVTHSYYDLTSQQDYLPVAEVRPDEYAAFVALPLIEDIALDVIFYPIYCESDLQIDIERRDLSGQITHLAESVARFRTDAKKSLCLDVRKALVDRNIPDNGSCNIVVSGADGSRIPTRITVGINYRTDMLGSNLSGSVSTTVGYGKRARFYGWGPLMLRQGASNLLMLSHLDKRRDSAGSAEITVTLYGRNGVICSQTHQTPNGTCLTLAVEALLQDFAYEALTDEVIWYDAVSSHSSYVAYQLHRSAQGFIGCDHSY